MVGMATRAEILIEGEDPSTELAPVARHWINIYGELVALTEGQAQRSESKDLTTRAERFRRRLDYWRRHHWELVGLDLDVDDLVVRHLGREVALTRREAQLLEFLLSHPNKHFSARALTSLAWQDSQLAAEQVRTYVVRLRRKLVELKAPCTLESEPRKGYALVF